MLYKKLANLIKSKLKKYNIYQNINEVGYNISNSKNTKYNLGEP